MKILKNNYLFYLVVIFAAFIIFIGTYGIDYLNPTFITPCMREGDYQQHYYGWKAFRTAEWTFPIGLFNNVTFPDYASVINVDAIPLFAVIFKVFRNVLPEDFQYFGLWTLISYIMQALIIAIIVDKLSKNRLAAILASVFTLFSSVLIFRTVVHEALSGNWVFLLSIALLLLLKELEGKDKKLYIFIAIIAVLSSTTHMYNLLFNGIVIACVAIEELILYKSIKKPLIILTEYIIIGLIIIYCMGGFSVKMLTADLSYFGIFNFNLDMFFNSLNYSNVVPQLPIVTISQADAFAYIGISGMLLIVIAVVTVIVKWKKVKADFLENRVSCIMIVALIVISAIVAIFPSVTFLDKKLIEIHVPDFIAKICLIFRCNGRVMWIAFYVIQILLIVIISKYWNKKILPTIVLAILIAIQIFEFRSFINYKYALVNEKEYYESVFNDDESMKQIAEDRSIKNVVVHESVERSGGFWSSEHMLDTDAYLWAIDNKKNVNTFYMGRGNTEAFLKRTRDAFENISNDTVYVFEKDQDALARGLGLNTFVVGNYVVGTVN